jgi:hypothetical protein
MANWFGKGFAFYTKKGELIASYPNYQELIIKSKHAPLQFVDVSPDKKVFLISSGKLYLFSFEDDQIIWERDFAHVSNSLFLQDIIVILCIDAINKTRSVKLISRKTGKVINEIKGIGNVSFSEENKILVSKNKKYYEYEIK